jgi:3',5'-cyclic AMP phosphodiesterase CpdA
MRRVLRREWKPRLNTRKVKRNLIVTGGDLIFDALGADETRTRAQWEIFTSVLKQNVAVPVRHTIGNHDVWGWNSRATYQDQPKFGKVWACEVLELEKPYYSFGQAGWHIVVLDSTHAVSGNGYTARLDEEQFEWLQDDLAKTSPKVPVIVFSHIPILSVCSMFDGENEKTGNWVIPGAWVHIDARRIKDLFRKHPNVKLCISGHEHLLDQVVYNGVNYFCNGAVSGGWWAGDYHECTYGYALIDLFNDGSFENRYVPYGWKTRV